MSTRAAPNAGGEEVFASRGMGCGFNTSLLEKAQAQIKSAVNLHLNDDDDGSDGWSDDSDMSADETKQNIEIADETELQIIPEKVQIRPQMNQVAEMLKNLLSNRRSLETLQSYKKFCDPASAETVTHFQPHTELAEEDRMHSSSPSRGSYSEGFGSNDRGRWNGLAGDNGDSVCYGDGDGDGGMLNWGDCEGGGDNEGECSYASGVSRYSSSPRTQSQREDVDAMDCDLSSVRSSIDGKDYGEECDDDDGEYSELCGSEWDRYQYSVYSQQSSKSDNRSMFDNEGCDGGDSRDLGSYEGEEEGEDEECSRDSYRSDGDARGTNPRAHVCVGVNVGVNVGAFLASPSAAPPHPHPPTSSICDTANMHMNMRANMRTREEFRGKDNKNRRNPIELYPQSIQCPPYPVFPCNQGVCLLPRRPQYQSKARGRVHAAERRVSGGIGEVFMRASLHPTTKHSNRLHASASAYERNQNEDCDTKEIGSSGTFGYLMKSSNRNGYGRHSVNKGREEKKRNAEDMLRQQLVRAELDRVQVLKLIVHLIGKEHLNEFFENEKNSPDMLELFKRTFSKQQDYSSL